jgi:hypothetical protein
LRAQTDFTNAALSLQLIFNVNFRYSEELAIFQLSSLKYEELPHVKVVRYAMREEDLCHYIEEQYRLEEKTHNWLKRIRKVIFEGVDYG